MPVLILVTILLLFLISCRNTSNMTSRQSIDIVYEDMKSGDILLITDRYNKAKNIYVLYKDDDEILVIFKKLGGKYLELKPLSYILKLYKKMGDHVVWLSLNEELTNQQKQAFDESLHNFYPRSQDINIVFIYTDDRRDFLKISTYTSKILLTLDILRIGSAFSCLDDPVSCMTQLYKNSGFINELDFNNNSIILV